ncbi:glycosyltransferase family 39 protein [bacterium]|nr:glycosyltransferase family 39 protein [candidate division CSSED10-310 bacterium]
MNRHRIWPFMLLVLVLLHGLSNWLWATRYKQFAQRKEIKYQSCAFAFDEFVVTPSLASLDRSLRRVHPVYPPLYFLLERLGLQVLGDSYRSFLFFNTPAMAILLFSVYFIGGRLFDRRIGFTAAVLLMCMPEIALYSRMTTLIFPVTAMVAAVIACLLWAMPFTSWRRSLAAGLAVGMGMLVKSILGTYIAGIFLVVAASTLAPVVTTTRRPAGRLTTGFRLLLAMAPLLFLAVRGMPWAATADGWRQAASMPSVALITAGHLIGVWLVLWLYVRILAGAVLSNPEPFASIAVVWIQVFVFFTERAPFHVLLEPFFGLQGPLSQRSLSAFLFNCSGFPVVDLSVLAFLMPGVATAGWLIKRHAGCPLTVAWRVRGRAISRRLIGLTVCVGVATMLFGAWYWRYLDDSYFSRVNANRTGIHFAYQVFFPFSLVYFDLSLLLAPLLLLVRRLRRDFAGRCLAAWYFMPVAIYSYVVLLDREPYRLLPALPAVALAAAAGLWTLTRRQRRLAVIPIAITGLFFQLYPFLGGTVRISHYPVLNVLLGGPELLFGKFILAPPNPQNYLPPKLPDYLQSTGVAGPALVLGDDRILGERFLSDWNMEYYQLQLRRQGWDPLLVFAPEGGGALRRAADLELSVAASEPGHVSPEPSPCLVTRAIPTAWNPLGEHILILEPVRPDVSSRPLDATAAMVDRIIAAYIAAHPEAESCLMLVDGPVSDHLLPVSTLNLLACRLKEHAGAVDIMLIRPELPALLFTRADCLLLAMDPAVDRLPEPFPQFSLAGYHKVVIRSAIPPVQAAICLLIAPPHGRSAPDRVIDRLLVEDNPRFRFDFDPYDIPPLTVTVLGRGMHEPVP